MFFIDKRNHKYTSMFIYIPVVYPMSNNRFDNCMNIASLKQYFSHIKSNMHISNKEYKTFLVQIHYFGKKEVCKTYIPVKE